MNHRLVIVSLCYFGFALPIESTFAATPKDTSPTDSVGKTNSAGKTDGTKTSPDSVLETCLLNAIATAKEDENVASLKQKCLTKEGEDLLPKRFLKEKATEENRFVITPHRTNYFLPVAFNNNPNQTPYISQNAFPGLDKPIDETEVKMQISLKVPLTSSYVFDENDGIYFGFTLKSFWQMYNTPASSPFRETNYRPEIFYQTAIPEATLDGSWYYRFGVEHESNGRTQLLSRSWNRIYLGLGFAQTNWAIYFQPWYRIKEDPKEVIPGENLPAAGGDDNPDIHRYMGYFELSGIYKTDDWQFTSMMRRNFNTGFGAIELTASFPFSGRLRAYGQYFYGYGESMIDYDALSHRIGIGLILTELL